MNPRLDWSRAGVEPDSATLTVPVLDADGFVKSEFQRVADRRNREARNVNGHRFLPNYGHRFSPPAAMFSPRWWPLVLPIV